MLVKLEHEQAAQQGHVQQAQVRQARQSAQVNLGNGSVRYATELPGSTFKEQGIDNVTPDTGWTCWRQLNMCSNDKFYAKGKMMTVSLGSTNTQQEQVQDGGTVNLMANASGHFKAWAL